jgi:DNA-binding transcriptional MocR family regulator
MIPNTMPLASMISADAQVMKSSLIRQLTGLVNRPDVISFAAGSPNAETFPHEQLAAIFNDLVTAEKGKIFQYSVTRGNAALIEAVCDRNRSAKGIDASAEGTILVSGSQPGQPFFVDGSRSNTLRLSFSNVSDENVGIGLEKISRLIARAAR